VVIGGATTTDGVAVATSGRLASVELFDSVSGQWAAGPALSSPRVFHTATLLDDGRVLVVGGENNLPSILDSAEILGFDAAGAACTTSTACVTGYCVDGVCCDTACDQLCESCVAADTGGADGTCAAVTAGTDPAAECTDSGGTNCSQNGFCSGTAGACQTYPGVPCTANGCTSGADCTSGYCVDGVCCDSPCAGTCEACTAALKGSGTDGTCAYVDSGLDPAGECASIGTGACAGAGACDGSGTCISSLSGTVCSPTGCTDAVTLSYEAYCDDYGTCGTVSTDSCAPYACDDVALSCKYSCTTDADCAPGVSCNGGACQPNPNGTSCIAGDECQSGVCIDGVCCESSCSGQCQACDVPGQEGYCTAVTGEPRGNRQACALGSDPECGGTCDGQDPYNCTYPDSSTLCGAATCDGDNVVADACNGSGTCVSQTTISCYPYGCSGGQCVTECTTDSDCASGFLCDASGSCVGENQPSCQDDHTILFPGGDTQSCVPYACIQGQCTSSCTTSDECGGGNVCYETTGTCAAPKDSGCGCRVAGRPTSGGFGWLAALGAALAVARRRRRQA
jgi:MYXO-CTERM domain-containing protein